MTPFRSPAPAPAPASAHAQRGITLIAAALMLLIFGLVTVAAFRNTLSSTQAIGNMQFRNESVAAANDTIDQLLSSDQFAKTPTAVTTQMNANPNTVDINGDNVADIQVTFPTVKVAGVDKQGPQCIRYRPVQNTQLDPDAPADLGCFNSGSANETAGLGMSTGGSGSTPFAGNSAPCADTDWSITVQATDKATNTTVKVTQGAQIRRDRATALNYCQ